MLNLYKIHVILTINNHAFFGLMQDGLTIKQYPQLRLTIKLDHRDNPKDYWKIVIGNKIPPTPVTTRTPSVDHIRLAQK